MRKQSLLTLTLMPTMALAQPLTITLNLPENYSAGGTFRVGVFTSQDAFDAGDVAYGTQMPAIAGTNTATFSNLPAGTYGISAYLDQNGNDELDRNLLGIPSEPYGFSLNPVIRFSAPKFDEFAFDYEGQGGVLSLDLNGI